MVATALITSIFTIIFLTFNMLKYKELANIYESSYKRCKCITEIDNKLLANRDKLIAVQKDNLKNNEEFIETQKSRIKALELRLKFKGW